MIWWVITPIWGHLYPIRQVVPLISHLRSYPPYHSYLHPQSLFLVHISTIIAEHNVMLSLPISPCHDHEVTLSPVYTEYNIHRVQLTLSTAYTEPSISPKLSVLPSFSRDTELTLECSFSFRHGSLHDPTPPASSPWELKGNITSSHPHGCELTNWWIESQH